MKKKKSWKSELIQWAFIIGVAGVLYLTGLHKDVIAGMQRLILQTGLFQPKAETDAQAASYEFFLLDENGETVKFEEFKGETVFLNFWATWCPPCIAEMPDIQKLYDELKTEQTAFVMISLDDDFEKAKEFVKRKDYSFPIYQLNSPLPTVYASQSIPTTFVISPEGEVVVARRGMADYYNETFIAFLRELSGN